MKKIFKLFTLVLLLCICLFFVGCSKDKQKIDTIYYVWQEYDYSTNAYINHCCVVDDASSFVSVENDTYIIDDRAIIISYSNEVDALPDDLKRVNKTLYVVEADGDKDEFCAYEVGNHCLVIKSTYFYQTIYKD